MEARASLKPGKPGTKRWVARFGVQLLRVRYRYGPERRKRFTTVELIVDEANWEPPEGERAPPAPTSDPPVAIQIQLKETALRRSVKDAGGRWEPTQGLWMLRREAVRALGLESRIRATRPQPGKTG
jgi:hypothetical protein